MTETALLIDSDYLAAEELAVLLQGYPVKQVLYAPTGPAALSLLRVAQPRLVFVRIAEWEGCREAVGVGGGCPPTVVFLSGRREKCARHLLGREVDFHLQPPYRASAVAKIFQRMNDPAFAPQSLNLFFVREGCRYHAIAVNELRRIYGRNGWLTLETDQVSYTVAGSLDRMQERLPVAGFERLDRHTLVASRCLFSNVLPQFTN